MMLSKTQLAKIEKLHDDLIESGKDVPPHVGLIHPFLVEYFADLQVGVSEGDFRIHRFAYAMQPELLDVFGTGKARIQSLLGSIIFLGIPVVAIAAGFFVSWWWLALLPLALVGMRLTKTAYDSSILDAAANHEPSFCLLYWSGQVSVWDVAARKMFYRNSETTFTWQAQHRRKRQNEKSEDDDEFFRVKPAIAKNASPPVNLEEARDYHADLDEMTGRTATLLAKWSTSHDGAWPNELNAETVVFLACYVAKLGSRHTFSIAGWNTFKLSVEHRMLAIRPDDSPRPASDGFSLVSYTSVYFGYLKWFEKLASPADQDNRELIEALAQDVDIDEEHLAEFSNHFRELVARANRQVLFKVWLVFEN